MKRTLTLALLACTAMILTGCNTPSKDQIKAGSGWAKSYYNQPTVAKIMEMTSTNGTGEVTIKNISTLALYTPVPPKSIIPRDPTWTEGFFDTLKTVAPWVFMGWAVSGGAFDGNESHTVNNNAAATP